MSAATETSLQEIAKEYQQLGLCAIPVVGKRPLIPWRPFVQRFPTTDECQNFPWHKATGLALVIGPATWELWPNLWCLDIEAEHRPDAENWLDRHVPSWRTGVVIQTGSGGIHAYFLADRPVQTRLVQWGEVRGQGSICVLPPSRHPVTSRPYQWLSERWTNLPTFNPDRVPGCGGTTGPVRELLSGTIPIGQRNIVLTRAAGLLRGELGLSADELLTVLRTLNTRCEEPLPERELQTIARSAQRWPQNPQLVISSNGHKWGPLGSGYQDPPVALEISALPEPEPRGWVVPDLLPEGAVSILFGDDGTGKSIVATHLALCVATGRPFLDRPVRGGKVLFVDTEFDESEFVRRVYRLARGMGLEGPPPGLWYYRTRYSLTSPGGQNDIATLVERHRPDLVIVDSITLGSLDVDLKEAHSAAALMEFLGRLSVTVLAIDHIPKPPPGTSLAYARPWGSFAKRARARHALLLTAAEGGGVVLRVTKSNLTATGMSVGLNIAWSGDTIRVTPVSLDDDSLAGIELHLPPIEQVYRVLAQHGPMTPDQVAEELGLAPGTVRNKLTALRQRGRVERLGDGRWQVVRPPTLVVGDGTQDSRFTGFTHYRVSESSESATKSTTACDICDGDADPGNHEHSLAFTGPGDDHQDPTTYGPDARFTGFTDSLPIVSESSESTTKSTTMPQIWRHEADLENHEHSLRFTETGEASESAKNLPHHEDPGHSSPHQSTLVDTDQATVPSTRVSGQVSPGQSQATVPSDEGPRCPVCRSAYELRPTDRDGWLQIRCRCRRPDEWWWVRADDPALGRKGVTQCGSG